MALKVGGLFAGVGGAELGLASVLDAEPAWFCELEKAPSKILAHHWPHVPNHGDVTKVDWASVEPVDIITGGFPCQDLSHAGKRAGINSGQRSSLFSEVISAVSNLRPRLVILENVRGLLSGKDLLDVPIDSCLCGWPYRWGGVHPHSGIAGADVPPFGDHRHDREGDIRSAGDESAVRGRDQVCSTCDGEVGRGVCLDCGRGCCDEASHRHFSLPDSEGGTSSDSPAGGGDTRILAGALGVEPGRTAALDRRRQGAVRDAEAEDARAEQQGTEPAVINQATGERTSVCPSCGRGVGGTASRSIERSWMGTVLRSLAHIGYVGRFYGLRAADVGAPHGRFRVFVFATPADSESVEQREPLVGVGPTVPTCSRR